MTHYQFLLQHLTMLAKSMGLKRTVVAHTGAGPMIRLDTVLQKPRLMIFAGQHGEEQSGPQTISRNLGKIVSYARERNVGLTIFPVVNPEGYDRAQRFNWRHQEQTNAFLDYVLKDGRVVSALAPGESATHAKQAKSQSDEDRVLFAELQREEPPEAVLDLHQDKQDLEGECYAWVTGPRAPYAQIMRHAAKPMANKPIHLDWTHIVPVTDENGLTELADGTVTDYLYRLGSKYTACVETHLQGGKEVTHRIEFKWILGMIDLLGR